MALIIPTGYGQVILHWSSTAFDSGKGATVLGYGGGDVEDPVSYQTFAQRVVTAWEQMFRSTTDAGCRLDSVEIVGPDEGYEQTVGAFGLRQGETPPPNVALLVKKVVPGRGRRRQGRIFWPALLQVGEVQEGGLITNTALSDLQAKFTDFFDDTTTTGPVNMVILQNSEGSSPPISPPPVVTGLQVQQKVASQRHRLRA